MSEALTERQRQILHVIENSMQERGYPPSVREIGEAVGLNSPSTVHNHLATLQKMGFLRRDPTKPRAIEVRFDTNSEVAMERRPSRHVPLIGDVAMFWLNRTLKISFRFPPTSLAKVNCSCCAFVATQ
jgi:repressor LexA